MAKRNSSIYGSTESSDPYGNFVSDSKDVKDISEAALNNEDFVGTDSIGKVSGVRIFGNEDNSGHPDPAKAADGSEDFDKGEK